MTRRLFPCLAILGLTLTACGPASATPVTRAPSASAPASTRAPESAAAASPTSAVPFPCPVAQGAAPEPAIPTILDYLNAGGDPDALAGALLDEGLAPLEGPAVLAADLTGDGAEDLALAFLVPPDAEAAPGGVIVVLECAGGAYRPAFQEMIEDPFETPALHFAQDLTADGVADLVLSHRLCGAHTCFEKLSVLVWNGAGFVNRLQGASDDLPYPIVDVAGPDQEGRYALTVTGTAVASVGAGPYRQRMRTWQWDAAAQALTPGEDVLLPSSFRIHVLLDADQAALAGDYVAAHDLYHRVVTDETLRDVEFGPSPREQVIAYAMFRQMVTYVLMEDLGDAQVAYGILQNSYPAGAPGRPYAELGTAFWEAHQASGDLAAACAAAQAYALAHSPDVLGPLYYGYANPTYTEVDLCPFGEE